MKHLLSRMLRTPDLPPEDRLLQDAMRGTRSPIPPEGLKERLIAQAISAADERAPAHPVRSRAWLAWAVPMAVATIIIGIILGVASQKHQTGSPPVIVQEAPVQSPSAPPEQPVVRQEAPGPEPVKEPVLREYRPSNAGTHPRRQRQRSPKPESKRYMAVNTPDAQEPAPVHSEAPRMQVTVSRTRAGGGYARASAWGMDEAGNPIKTQWTIVDDPNSDEPVEELSVTDADGRRQSITVAASVSNKRGEQLWNDSSDL